jgi:hypothetical protein
MADIIDDNQIHILAHTVILRTLVSRAKLENPKFQELALRHFDAFLGSMVRDPAEPPIEAFVRVREEEVKILNTSEELLVDRAASEPSLTWKRRFLLWLSS